MRFNEARVKIRLFGVGRKTPPTVATARIDLGDASMGGTRPRRRAGEPRSDFRPRFSADFAGRRVGELGRNLGMSRRKRKNAGSRLWDGLRTGV